METHFQMSDNLYVKAKVPPTDKVCLWLGVSMIFLISKSYQMLLANTFTPFYRKGQCKKKNPTQSICNIPEPRYMYTHTHFLRLNHEQENLGCNMSELSYHCYSTQLYCTVKLL